MGNSSPKANCNKIILDLKSARAELETTRAKLATTEAELATTKADLGTTNYQLGTTKDNLDNAINELDRVRTELLRDRPNIAPALPPDPKVVEFRKQMNDIDEGEDIKKRKAIAQNYKDNFNNPSAYECESNDDSLLFTALVEFVEEMKNMQIIKVNTGYGYDPIDKIGSRIPPIIMKKLIDFWVYLPLRESYSNEQLFYYAICIDEDEMNDLILDPEEYLINDHDASYLVSTFENVFSDDDDLTDENILTFIRIVQEYFSLLQRGGMKYKLKYLALKEKQREMGFVPHLNVKPIVVYDKNNQIDKYKSKYLTLKSQFEPNTL